MDQPQNSSSGVRSNQDIALDLLKFVAVTTGIGRHTAPSAGFTAATASNQDEQVKQILDLYSRCLRTVEGKV